jgi:ankyrin repeat protein
LARTPELPNDDGTEPVLVAAGIGVRSPTEDPGTEPEILEAVNVAIDLGGDVNSVDKNGETVMHGAAVRGLNSLIQLLTDRGARVEIWNRPNKRGYTPLVMAEGHQKINKVFSLSHR